MSQHHQSSYNHPTTFAILHLITFAILRLYPPIPSPTPPFTPHSPPIMSQHQSYNNYNHPTTLSCIIHHHHPIFLYFYIYHSTSLIQVQPQPPHHLCYLEPLYHYPFTTSISLLLFLFNKSHSICYKQNHTPN